MTVYSPFQPPILLAVALVALVIGTSSVSRMTEVEVDRFVCLACQARHFPAIFSSRRALRIHITKSKNPKCGQEWSKIKIMTRPGDVIAGGSGGMGPCPPPQHQPPGGVDNSNILCMCNIYTLYIPCIYNVYVWYVKGISHIPWIYMVYTWFIPGISNPYGHVIHMAGIYLVKTSWVCSVPFFILIYL
jgi:hypothetical protein